MVESREEGAKVADDILVTADGGRANGSQSADGETMDLSDTAGTGDLGGVVATSVWGGARVPEDWGGAGGKEEPAVTVGVEELSVA